MTWTVGRSFRAAGRRGPAHLARVTRYHHCQLLHDVGGEARRAAGRSPGRRGCPGCAAAGGSSRRCSRRSTRTPVRPCPGGRHEPARGGSGAGPARRPRGPPGHGRRAGGRWRHALAAAMCRSEADRPKRPSRSRRGYRPGPRPACTARDRGRRRAGGGSIRARSRCRPGSSSREGARPRRTCRRRPRASRPASPSRAGGQSGQPRARPRGFHPRAKTRRGRRAKSTVLLQKRRNSRRYDVAVGVPEGRPARPPGPCLDRGSRRRVEQLESPHPGGPQRRFNVFLVAKRLELAGCDQEVVRLFEHLIGLERVSEDLEVPCPKVSGVDGDLFEVRIHTPLADFVADDGDLRAGCSRGNRSSFPAGGR